MFDIESNKEVITSIREPDPGMLVQQKPIILTPEKLTIYRRHIPPQIEIDNALAEMRTKVLRQLVVNFETADLIREYDCSMRFKDIYTYIARDKLPGNQQIQKRVLGEACNFIIANRLLFKLDKVKEGRDWKIKPLLVILEKFEMNLFNMYQNSLFVCHQGLWKTFLTMRDKFYISNLFAKLRNYIDACHICLRMKPKQNRNKPYYGYIPKDYIPLEHLAIHYLSKALAVVLPLITRYRNMLLEYRMAVKGFIDGLDEMSTGRLSFEILDLVVKIVTHHH